METIVSILMLLVGFNYVLKQTYRKPYFIVSSALICTLFIGFLWPVAIEQSKTQVSMWLANSSLMLDIAVVLSIEVALQLAFCIIAANIETSGKIKRRTLWLYRFLRWFPGLLIFPVLFCLLTVVIFTFPHLSFSVVAWTLACVTGVGLVLLTWFLKWILPEKEIRLEVLFFSNVLIAILGIIATVNGRTAVQGISEVDWSALLGLILITLTGGILGVIIYKYKAKKKH